VQRVEVLPFHRLGAQTYAALGLTFLLADTPAPDEAQDVRDPKPRPRP
jgi:pyruvate formate lyase activating enzyme